MALLVGSVITDRISSLCPGGSYFRDNAVDKNRNINYDEVGGD